MVVAENRLRTDLGSIPEDWKVVCLADVGKALIGLTYTPSQVKPFGTLVLRSSNIRDGQLVFDDNVYVAADIPDRIKVRPGDILVCVRNGSRALIGKSAILDERTRGMTFGAFMAVYRSDLGRYAGYVFQSDILKKQINEHLGATINQVTNKSLNSFKLPLPPTKLEREAIEIALRDVDALILDLERLITKKRDIKQASMQQLLTGKTRLPGFATDWVSKEFSELFDFTGGVSASRAQLTSDFGYCYLHYGDIHSSTKPFVDVDKDFAKIPKLPIDIKRVGAGSLLRSGDVVFVDASEDDEGTTRHVVVRNDSGRPFISGLHTIVAKRKTGELDPNYLCYCFQTVDIQDQFKLYAVGTKVKGVNKTSIKNIRLRFPELDEQVQIARILSDMDSGLEGLMIRLDKTRDIKQGMMQQLLTGKVRLA